MSPCCPTLPDPTLLQRGSPALGELPCPAFPCLPHAAASSSRTTSPWQCHLSMAGPALHGRATSPCLRYPAPPHPRLPPSSTTRLRAAPEVAREAEEAPGWSKWSKMSSNPHCQPVSFPIPNYFLPASGEAASALGGTLGSNVLLLPISLVDKSSQGEFYHTNPNTHTQNRPPLRNQR